MPVLLATDANTDMGRIAEANGFGLWAHSGDLDAFMANMARLAASPSLIQELGQHGNAFLKDNYTVDIVARIIEK